MTALEAVAPEREDRIRHSVVLGERRSGRSTVLLEVARRAATDRKRLVVHLRSTDDLILGRQELTRHLLTAIVEALAALEPGTQPAWYLAWRNRVYLRDRATSTADDLLSSSLVLASEIDVTIDRAVLERDLNTLLNLARAAGLIGIVVCVDDATPLTEDPGLIEALLDIFDSVDSYSLLITGLPATAAHFIESASPCLARFAPVWLNPFRGPHQVFTSLRAPLSGSSRDWLQGTDAAFLRDVLRLTGGNPYELMLVGHHLWLTCESGEQELYGLTPRVLDRIIPHLSVLASGGDALRDGAQAIDRLADEQVGQAVELVALSRLTVRQIAIARIMKIGSRDADRVDRGVLNADVQEEAARVLSELEGLQEAGVVQIHADQVRFSVVGGQAASVLLKYKARARIGAGASSQPFELGFLLAVGRALARDVTLRALESVADSTSLGFAAIMSTEGAGRLSPRPAIRKLSTSGGIVRLAQAEIDLVAWSGEKINRIAELLTTEDPTIAILYTGVTHGREQLEYTELWELPPGVTHEELDRVWSDMTEEWAPVVEAADLNWSGSDLAVLNGAEARQALIVLQRYAATSAVRMLFDRWNEDRDEDSLALAERVGNEAVETIRAADLSELEVGGELSAALSQIGFLRSLDDARLDEAKAVLEDALRTGVADGWVTAWNLANVEARQGDTEAATRRLDDVAATLEEGVSKAVVLFYIPGRDAVDSLVNVATEGIVPLLNLQRAVMDGDADALTTAIGHCHTSEDTGAIKAAEWVAESRTTAA